MKKFMEMTDVELLDQFDIGVLSANDVRNPELFEQEDTELVSDGYQYTLTPSGEKTGCLVIGHVRRKGKRYSITTSY